MILNTNNESEVSLIETNYNGIAKVLTEFRLMYENERIDKDIINEAFKNFIHSPNLIISNN